MNTQTMRGANRASETDPRHNLIVSTALQFVQKAAQRIVRLTNIDWDHLHSLGLQLKSADETERSEIIEAILEVFVPDQMIGSPKDDETLAVAEDSRARATDYRKKVGRVIRSRREELGMTQQELASKADLPQSHISRLENGKHAATHITIRRLAKALRVKAIALDPGFPDEG